MNSSILILIFKKNHSEKVVPDFKEFPRSAHKKITSKKNIQVPFKGLNIFFQF